MKKILIVVALAFAGAAGAAETPVAFVTDKAQVANCEYVGRADNALIGFNLLAFKSNDDMQRMVARKLGADTVLRRGKFDSMGRAYKCK
jgi:hypothetical protein